MTDEERNFIIKVNVDKAKNKTILPILLIIISILTYVFPLIVGEFDFGIVFEVISLIFLIIGRNYMNKYDETKSKKFIICAMIPVGWMLIYDIIVFISSISDIVDFLFLGYDYLCGEILSILYMIMLFAINKDLAKADNPVKYKESTDWFYEKYEEKDNEENKGI